MAEQQDKKEPSNYGSVVVEISDKNGESDDVLLRKSLPDKQEHSLLGIVFIMLGSFSFSVMFLLVKIMADANTFTLVLYRSFVQIAISLAALLREGENPLGPPEARFWLVCRGFFGAAAVCAWFFGIQILPLPDAVTLQFTTPPFAAVFAVFLVGEPWKPLDMVGAAVCLTGVALIAHPTWLFPNQEVPEYDDDEKKGPSVFLKALAVMVTEAGAAMAGIAYVAVRKIGDQASAVVMVLYYGAISVPMCFIGSALLEGTWNCMAVEGFSVLDYFLLFLMGIAGYGGQWFTNLGLQKETAATVSDLNIRVGWGDWSRPSFVEEVCCNVLCCSPAIHHCFCYCCPSLLDL